MFRTAFAFLLGAVGFFLTAIGAVMLFLTLAHLRPDDVWSWQFSMGGMALIWAACTLHSLVAIEQQRGPIVVHPDPRSPVCADCGYANYADAERCARCRRILT